MKFFFSFFFCTEDVFPIRFSDVPTFSIQAHVATLDNFCWEGIVVKKQIRPYFARYLLKRVLYWTVAVLKPHMEGVNEVFNNAYTLKFLILSSETFQINCTGNANILEN